VGAFAVEQRWDVTAAVARLADELESAGSPERSDKERAYLKSDLKHCGTSVPVIRRAATALVRTSRPLEHITLVELVEELWSHGVHELRMADVEVLELEADHLAPTTSTSAPCAGATATSLGSGG
jgi:hypothetical protein